MADDADMMAMMGMSGFGKQTKKRTVDVAARYETTKRAEPAVEKDGLKVDDKPVAKRARVGENVPEEEDDEVGPMPAPGPSTEKQDGAEEDEDDGDEDDEAESDLDDESTFPITHEISLKDHTKVVSALAVDPSGARVVTGSHDYDVKLWDFGGMDARFKPFRSWEPAESYHVHDLKYSNAGDKRDGEEVATFIKGDPYIRDMKNTAGHVGELTACAWHPKESNLFITSSYDSTIRIWDVENKRKQKTVIVVKSKERGTRTKVMSCAYSRDGKLIAGACLDGALHIWNTNSNFVRPSLSIENAHVKDTETGSVTFALDGHTVLTRGGDDTVKLWDTRSFKKPVTTATNVPTLYPGTSAIFSPDEKYIVTGAAAVPGRQPGRLLFMRRDGASGENGLQPVRSVILGEKVSAVKVVWHSKINQVLASLSDGSVRVLYSPNASTNGAKLCVTRAPKKVTIEDVSAALRDAPILTPHALPMFREDEGRTGQRRRDKDRSDAVKTRKPMPPVSGPGRGGRVGASATQHIVQHMFRDTSRDEDPREALLKYAAKDGEELRWTKAWKDSGNVFAAVEEEEKEEGA
ncbi:WD repeat-containing protein 70 [Mus musculus] [Rhizoctonia solani]|uniref:WD repeat-containing protein 70 [Mus musculus] n=1 Tax=Rhizoctonia solani TaxID=456999 RepID=A0A0K6GGA8_9AGAM|nr:WD repeat-containing protein 70 [Mus musculus] [Rhizoctonia solani]